MKTIPTGLATHMAQTLTTMATLWKINRHDGTIMGFCDHDNDITVDDGSGDDPVTYLAATGYNRSALQTQNDMSVDNLEITGVLDSDAITADDIHAGVYDGARVRVMLVNWAAPTDGVCIIAAGFIGDISVKGKMFVAEQRGLMQALDTNFIREYTPDCDADLGDARCTVDTFLISVTGTVTAVTDPQRIFTAPITGAHPDGFFSGGKIVFDSGANAGRTIEVRGTSHGNGTVVITLYLPIGDAVIIGDTFRMYPGCDKSSTTCKGIFNNLVNFRGFPDVPGLDLTVQTPNAV